jgi:hypothetical protein
MSTATKPKYCNQNWNDMSETKGGRMCGKCEKLIIDFRKSKWSDIEKIQVESNNTTCGLYSEKQLKYWGQQPPLIDSEIKKPFFISVIFLSLLSVIPKIGKSQIKKDSTYKLTEEIDNRSSQFYVIESPPILIKGKLFDKQNKEGIAFANIVIDGTKKITSTDINGNYQIDLSDVADSINSYTIKARFVGYKPIELKINHKVTKTEVIDLPIESQGTNFAVEAPKKKKFRLFRRVK